jgi:5'(3')-deoxyribonucleotidase
VRVLLDVDGVLADFLTPFCETAFRVTGRRYAPTDFYSYGVFDHITEPGEDVVEITRRCYAEWAGVLHDILQPVPGAVEGVEALRAGGCEIYIVTQAVAWHRERALWLKHHFGVDPHSIVYTAAKHVVSGHAFVDDHPEHVMRWKDANSGGHALLFAQAYNRSSRLIRYDWDGIVDALT